MIEPNDQLNLTFSALADPTRRAILARLSHGECSVKELAKPFDISLPAITKHLKVLQKAGLIIKSRQAQFRPCSLSAKPLEEASKWFNQYRVFWEESLDRLEIYLEQMQEQKKID